MSDDVLTDEAIQKLTGYKQAKKQCEWLARAGIWFGQDRNGRPRTTWDHVNNPISLRLAAQRRPELDNPNFDAM